MPPRATPSAHRFPRSRGSAPKARCIRSRRHSHPSPASRTRPFSPGDFPALRDFPGFAGTIARTRVAAASRTHAATSAPRCGISTRISTPRIPTIFELAPSRFNAMSMLGRGTARSRAARPRRAHARARRVHALDAATCDGWLALDRYVARVSTQHIIEQRPEFACIALLGLDKASHSAGHDSALARPRSRGIDAAVAELRDALERARHVGRDAALDRERSRPFRRARARRSRRARARERASRARASVALHATRRRGRHGERQRNGASLPRARTPRARGVAAHFASDGSRSCARCSRANPSIS